MRFDAMIIAVLYNHFTEMKSKGRKVIPWFQTISVLSFSIVMQFLLLGLIFFNIIYGNLEIDISESHFLISFILLIVAIFFIIKRCYFDTSRHIAFLEEFKSLPSARRKRNSILVLAIICILPFALIYFLFLIRG
jgi:hypothetical protein